MRWFDGHLDLAYLAAVGRDMLAPASTQQIPNPPASVTLPSLAQPEDGKGEEVGEGVGEGVGERGGVVGCLATIFTEAGGEDPRISYEPGDARGALTVGLRQLEIYQEWARQALVDLWGVDAKEPPKADAPLKVGILIEGADPIVEPADLPWWKSYGVVAIGMAWWTPSRYAGGNGTDIGLTPLGRDLVVAMDELALVHDLSHLSQRATDELLSRTDARVIASHSNCRALINGENQRHLTDDVIREIGRRAGIIGLNLYSRFIDPSCDKNGRASLDACVRHIEHVCELVGSRSCVGLGSDMDGGFGADRLPQGIDGPSDLDRLADALQTHGWSDAEVEAFAFGNWDRFWQVQA